MNDLIDRQAAINALLALTTFERVGALYEYVQDERSREREWIGGILDAIDAVICLPTAEPHNFDEWCEDCKEYDQEKNCCPRFNRVIRTAMEEAKGECNGI